MNQHQAPIELQQQVQNKAQQGQWAQAQHLNEQLLKAYPKDAQAWINHSMLLFQTGQKQAVIKAIEQACQIAPDDLAFQLHRIMALEALSEVKRAIELANELADKSFKSNQQLESLAAFLNKHQQFPSAANLYQQGLKLQPKNNQLRLNLAMTQQYLGQIESANELADQAIIQEPHNGDVHFFRSHLKRQTEDSNHIKALQQTSKQTFSNPTQQAKVLFALAKELEDCQQYQDSFETRSQGAKVYRHSFQYDLQSDLDFMQAIQDAYHREFLQRKPDGCTTQEPIFIVGLPRSGTTLLERIIGSHSEIVSAGELTNFNRCMLSGIQQLGLNPQMPRKQMVAASVKINFNALGENYLQSTRPISGITPHFIDKFPQNAQYVGLIHRALPRAKILILERHPLDVCYAVYKQMFTDIYQFSYDLDELAQYYIRHQQLMNHWQSALPDQVKTVRYEDLISELETTAKQVVEFCGLEWQEACINFHQNQQTSNTASASQVRQKIYSTSVGLWKNYEDQLKPLITQLQQAGCLKDWL